MTTIFTKKTNSIRSILCILLLVLIVCPTQIFAAGTIDLDATVTLTINSEANMTFDVYRVADVDSYQYSVFTLSDDFADAKVEINDLKDNDAWLAAAETLANYATGKTPIRQGTTDESGVLKFDNLTPGLYLVIGEKSNINGYIYTFTPYLISLPALDEEKNEWNYDVTTVPKFETEEEPPIIPPTPGHIQKVWKDSGYEFKRPSSVKVEVYRNGEYWDTIELNELNRWQADLPDTVEQWTVREVDVPGGYTVTISNNRYGIVITNTYHPDIPTIGKKVIKVWEDGGNIDARPSGIQVELLHGNTVYDTVTLNDANDWQYFWRNLPAIGYGDWSVREKYIPDGYTATVTEKRDTFIITNTREVETTTITAVKVWDDVGFESLRPASITVELLNDGEVYDTVTLDNDNHWMYQWTGLQASEAWSIRELTVPDYTTTIERNGNVFVITNTVIPVETPPTPVNRSVLKIWKNDEEHLDERPTSIEVALLRDGEVYEIVTLNEENGWQYTWMDLDGTYEWTVKEVTVLDSYTSSILQDGDLFILTNKYSEIPQTGQLWWPVPLLLMGGLTLIVIGLMQRRKEY